MNIFGVILLILNVESGKYKFINQQKTWYNADQYCKQTFGTQLAIIKNAYDNNLAAQACQGHECWFGANDRSREHKFKFSNGESVSYTNWAPHEPNNLGNEDCVEIRGNGQWNDNNCHHKRPFICDAGAPRPRKGIKNILIFNIYIFLFIKYIYSICKRTISNDLFRCLCIL